MGHDSPPAGLRSVIIVLSVPGFHRVLTHWHYLFNRSLLLFPEIRPPSKSNFLLLSASPVASCILFHFSASFSVFPCVTCANNFLEKSPHFDLLQKHQSSGTDETLLPKLQSDRITGKKSVKKCLSLLLTGICVALGCLF